MNHTDELVVILAAGVGSRLKPFTDKLPKCLVPISGIPLLSLSTAQMKKAGLDNISYPLTIILLILICLTSYPI